MMFCFAYQVFYLFHGMLFPVAADRLDNYLEPHLLPRNNTAKTLQKSTHRILQNRVFRDVVLKLPIRTNGVSVRLLESKICSPNIMGFIRKLIRNATNVILYFCYDCLGILGIHSGFDKFSKRFFCTNNKLNISFDTDNLKTKCALFKSMIKLFCNIHMIPCARKMRSE